MGLQLQLRVEEDLSSGHENKEWYKMKKGDLVIHNSTGKTGTIVSNQFTKLFRDASDWEACAAGFDSGYAASAISILWHETMTTRTHQCSKLRQNHSIIKDANNQEKEDDN